MKKKILILSLLSSACLYASEVQDRGSFGPTGEEEVWTGEDSMLVLAENEEILRSGVVSVERAQKAVQQNLQKRSQKLAKVEELEANQALRQKLERQILESLAVLESELTQTEVNRQATAIELARLNDLWEELQKTRGEDFLATPIRKTAADKKADHDRQQGYLTDLRDRIEGIEKGMAVQQDKGAMEQRELVAVRKVIATLEEDSLSIAETHEGAAGTATVEVLREYVEERKLAAQSSQEEEMPQQKGVFSNLWGKCIIA